MLCEKSDSPSDNCTIQLEWGENKAHFAKLPCATLCPESNLLSMLPLLTLFFVTPFHTKNPFISKTKPVFTFNLSLSSFQTRVFLFSILQEHPSGISSLPSH